VEQAQLTLAAALASNAQILASKLATNAQIATSNALVAAAEKKLDEEVTKAKLEQFNKILNAAGLVLQAIFGKSKAGAIAAVIIHTAQAIMKTFAEFGWPWGIIPAAAVAAIGYTELQKIRSTDTGFAQGTPGTSFVDFGRGTAATLHGREAVVNQAQGASLAGMVEDALSADRGEIVAELRATRADQRDLMNALPRMIRDQMQFGMA
jgi:hypothetical protein